MHWNILYALLAAGAGVCLALQAPANSRFRTNLDNTAYAAYWSMCGTLLFATVFMAILRPSLPSMSAIRQTEWWNWIGGPLGALFVLAGVVLVKHLGAAPFIALVVGGQLIGSLVLDHFALLGLEQQSLSFGRILGAVLVLAGVVCIKYL